MRSVCCIDTECTLAAGKKGLFSRLLRCTGPQSSLYNQFAGLEDSLKGTPLVYFPTVHSSVLAAWSGPRFAAYSETDTTFASLKDGLPRGELVTDSSVSSVPRRLRSNWERSEFFFLV